MLWNPELFWYCFILYNEKMLTDTAKIKSWNRDGRDAP